MTTTLFTGSLQELHDYLADCPLTAEVSLKFVHSPRTSLWLNPDASAFILSPARIFVVTAFNWVNDIIESDATFLWEGRVFEVEV